MAGLVRHENRLNNCSPDTLSGADADVNVDVCCCSRIPRRFWQPTHINAATKEAAPKTLMSHKQTAGTLSIPETGMRVSRLAGRVRAQNVRTSKSHLSSSGPRL